MGPEPVRLAAATTITTERLALTPLRPEDAAEMAAVLDDPALHGFIGGRPATPPELADRYARLAAGSGRADEIWLNWIVRDRDTAAAVGTVQATITPETAAADVGWTASVAWVIGVPWQGRGYATEAARGLVAWLRQRGVTVMTAAIHPDHRASEAVAVRAGLTLTTEEVDGERLWRGTTVDG
jgi:RimJ/RimL family protein N-acetyltransferase